MNFFKSLIKQKTFWLLLVILALAAFFRFYNLEAVPPGLYPDVAINGNDAIKALATGDFKIFYPDNNGREGLFINLIALSFWLFGASVWAIKIVPAIFGWLTVLGLYFLAKQLFSYLAPRHAKTIALLAAFFIAISFWHVNFSRLGFRAIMVPFFLVWSLYFLYKGLNFKSGRISAIGYMLSAGLLFGLGFHTYIAFRVAPLLLLIPLVFALARWWPKFRASRSGSWKFFKKSYWQEKWWLWDIFFLFLVLAALPMAIYFFQHPQDFIGRTGQVSVFASPNPVKSLGASLIQALGMFNVQGDCNWRHNFACQPQLFWLIGIFFLIGLLITIIKILRPASYRNEHSLSIEAHWLLLVWFGAMLLPEILTNEGLPHALRSIGTIPPVFLWAGLGAWWLAQNLKAWLIQNNTPGEKIAVAVFFTICLLLLAIGEFSRYFLDWGRRAETRDAFTQRLVNEGQYLASLPANVQKFVLINEGGVAVPYPDGLPMPAQTIIFFNQRTPNIHYLVLDHNAAAKQPVKIYEPLIFVPLQPDKQIFSDLAKYFPGGRLEKINDFEAFKVNF